ncbi:hypothetical protein D3C75_1134080 [compost metagenome]
MKKLSKCSLGLVADCLGYSCHAVPTLEDKFSGHLHPAFDQIFDWGLPGALRKKSPEAEARHTGLFGKSLQSP